MSEGVKVILTHRAAKQRAMALLDSAPPGSVMTITPPRRTIPQNDKMWATLTELARAKPDGRSLPVHKWKSLAMDAAGKKPDWERSLDGESMVCVGYKSSRLTKEEMSEVIEAINAYAAEHGVELSE